MIERYMVSTPTAKSNDNPQKGNARGLPGPKVATGCQQRRAHTPYRAWLNPYELFFPGGRNGNDRTVHGLDTDSQILPGPKVATGCQQRRAHTPYRAWLNPHELFFPGGRNGIVTERYMVSTPVAAHGGQLCRQGAQHFAWTKRNGKGSRVVHTHTFAVCC